MENQEHAQSVPKTEVMVKLKRHLGLKLAVVVLVILLGLSLFTDTFSFLKGSTGKAVAVKGVSTVEFYVMSQCPYGVQVENAIAPVLKKFGENVKFSIDFIAEDNEDGTFSSLHGQPEVDEDIRQLCAMKIAPDKYMDYILCINKDYRNAAAKWQGCASSAGIDANALKACAEGAEGKQLLSDSIKKSEAAHALGSPTIIINGDPYEGARDELSFQRAICKGIPTHPECKNMPECKTDADCEDPAKEGKCEADKCVFTDPVAFEVVVLNDKACADCDTEQVNAVTKRLFKGATFRNVDISSEEGKKLVSDLKLKFVPAYLFAPTVTTTSTWATNAHLQGAFEQVGSWYKLRDEAVGASHWIDEKAKAEHFASLGIKLGDNKPQMDFFVMSYCPYGNIAEEAISPVYDMLKADAQFIPHYIWYSNYGGGGAQYCLDAESVYCSMHGVQEAHQNIRELCVAKYMGMDSWFRFAKAMNTKCTAQNADTCWEAVATELKLNVQKIKDCEKNEALALAETDKKIGDASGVSGSQLPQIFVDGEKYNGAWSSAGYQSAVCNAFDTKPEACKNIIVDTAATQQASADVCGA